MSADNQSLLNEKRILAAMRQTLSSVVRDVTPSSSSLKSPLQESTTKDIVMCFGLITAREREIDAQLNLSNTLKPHFTDEPKTVHTVSLNSLKSSLKQSNQ